MDDLFEDVGEMEAPPEPPDGGVRRQWLPAVIRWPVRVAIVPFVWLDMGAQWVARQIIKPPYVKAGACKKRGNCCYYILIARSRGLLGWLDLFWHTQINGFYRRNKQLVEYQGKLMHVMGCRYLTKEGQCGHYHLRPMICRTWPRIEYFGRPQYLKGCGFHAEARKPSATKISPVKIPPTKLALFKSSSDSKDDNQTD